MSHDFGVGVGKKKKKLAGNDVDFKGDAVSLLLAVD